CWRALDNAPADTPPHTVLFQALADHPERDAIISTLFGIQPGDVGQYPTLYDLAQDLPPITWLWPGWIPRGMLTLFGAVPGVGKSLVALDLCRRLIHGEPFPDGTPAPPSDGPVLYIDAEAVPQITHARAASWDMDTRHLYLMLPEADALLDFGQAADRDRLVEMTYTLRPALIVVDSLSSVTSKSENAIEDVRALLGFFSNLAREYSLALVLIHHARKRGATLGGAPVFTPITLDDFRGSGHIVAMARSVLGLSVVPDGPKPDSNGPRQLEVIKSNLARLPEPLGFTLDEIEPDGVALRWGAAPEPWREPTKLDRCIAWLETLLREANEPLAPKDVVAQAAEEGFSRAMVFRARKALGEQIQDTAGRRNPANLWKWDATQ
ncbi:MAG: AAA family ATPase, partial [Anaerolineales bacterium]